MSTPQDPAAARRADEVIARGWFRNWIDDLSDVQLAALLGNWENIMNDAALDRVDSWVTADQAIAELRKNQERS